jgi:hypothetical protein
VGDGHRAARLKEERKNKVAYSDTPEPSALPPRQPDNYSHVRSTGYGGAGGSGGYSPAQQSSGYRHEPAAGGYYGDYGGHPAPPQPPAHHYSARGYSGDQGGYGYPSSGSYTATVSHEPHYGAEYGNSPAQAPSTYYRSSSREGVGAGVTCTSPLDTAPSHLMYSSAFLSCVACR